MDVRQITPALVFAWLEARSIARQLPAPVPDRGGFRVDTGSESETSRWVFPHVVPGLTELGETIDRPGFPLKLCGPPEELRAALPARWRIEPPAYFMVSPEMWATRPAPAGYRFDVSREGAAWSVEARDARGALAASGHAAETARAFVYDRILVQPDHRRIGLGHALLHRLRALRSDPQTPELLAATEAGQALYRSLGWRTLSSYCTAVLDA